MSRAAIFPMYLPFMRFTLKKRKLKINTDSILPNKGERLNEAAAL
jgi:hypothetical protein